MIDLRELAQYENREEEVTVVCIDGQTIVGMPGEVDDEEDSGLGEPGITIYLPNGGMVGIGQSKIRSIETVKMQGLKTQEEDDFVAFFKLVQDEAARQNKVFFLECEDGNESNINGMEVCDLQGWLISPEEVERFEPIWRANEVDDEWTDQFCFVTWNSDNGLRIAFEE